jgi:hypothetical protein
MKKELIIYFSIPFAIVAIISLWEKLNPPPPEPPTPRWVTEMTIHSMTPEEKAEAEADMEKDSAGSDDDRDFAQDNRGHYEQ